jgi:hypothetical protein
LIVGDLGELPAALFSALMITFAGYPLAVTAGELLPRVAPAMVTANPIRRPCYWLGQRQGRLLIHPFWQCNLSDPFCAALVAECGLATGAWLRRILLKANLERYKSCRHIGRRGC